MVDGEPSGPRHSHPSTGTNRDASSPSATVDPSGLLKLLPASETAYPFWVWRGYPRGSLTGAMGSQRRTARVHCAVASPRSEAPRPPRASPSPAARTRGGFFAVPLSRGPARARDDRSAGTTAGVRRSGHGRSRAGIPHESRQEGRRPPRHQRTSPTRGTQSRTFGLLTVCFAANRLTAKSRRRCSRLRQQELSAEEGRWATG
jgi:hypothetical protein